MFETLATEGINIEMISTSTIRISCVVAEDDVERAVQALHAAFELEREVHGHEPLHRSSDVRVGLMGATGMVGTEMLRILEERNFPVGELRALRVAAFGRSQAPVRATARSRARCSVTAASTVSTSSSSTSTIRLAVEWAPQAAAAGAIVVDNSAAFRMDPDVPLVVAEVNPEDLRAHPEGHRVVPELHDDDPGHRARAAAPRRAHRPHGRVDATSRCRARVRSACTSSTRSGRSSSGRTEELRRAGTLDRPIVESEVWSKPIAGNVIPLAGSMQGRGLHVGGVEDGARDAQDPPRRRHQVQRSPACASRCSSATRSP